MRKGWSFIDIDKFEKRFNTEGIQSDVMDTLFAEFETIVIGLLKDNKDKIDFKTIRQLFLDRTQKLEVEIATI